MKYFQNSIYDIQTAVVIYETRPTIPSSLRKRRSIEMSKKELRNETTIEILSVNHQEKSREMWKTSHPISFLSRKIQEYEIDSPRKWNLSTPREIKKQKRQLEFKNENESSEYSNYSQFKFFHTYFFTLL